MRLTVGRVKRQVEPKGIRLSIIRAFRGPAGSGGLIGVIGAGLADVAVYGSAAFRIVAMTLAVAAALAFGYLHGPGPESTIGDKNVEVERLAEVAESADGESLREVAGVLEQGLWTKFTNVRGMLALAEIGDE